MNSSLQEHFQLVFNMLLIYIFLSLNFCCLGLGSSFIPPQCNIFKEMPMEKCICYRLFCFISWRADFSGTSLIPGYFVTQNKVRFVTATEKLIACISFRTVCQLLHGFLANSFQHGTDWVVNKVWRCLEDTFWVLNKPSTSQAENCCVLQSP